MDEESKDLIRLITLAPVRNGENSETNEMSIGGVSVSDYIPSKLFSTLFLLILLFRRW